MRDSRRHHIQMRVLGAVLRHVSLTESLGRLGINAQTFDSDLQAVYQVALAGHIKVKACVRGSDVSSAGAAVRRVWASTTTMAPADAIALARTLVEAEPVLVVQEPLIEPPASVDEAVEAPPVPMSGKPTSKAAKIRDLLRGMITDRGASVPASRLQSIGRAMGLLRPDGDIGRETTWARQRKKLGIITVRVGGPDGGHWEWRLNPSRDRAVNYSPAWSRSDQD